MIYMMAVAEIICANKKQKLALATFFKKQNITVMFKGEGRIEQEADIHTGVFSASLRLIEDPHLLGSGFIQSHCSFTSKGVT